MFDFVYRAMVVMLAQIDMANVPEGIRFDVLACPRCGDRVRHVALIEEAPVIGRILRHLGLCQVKGEVPDTTEEATNLEIDGGSWRGSEGDLRLTPATDRAVDGREVGERCPRVGGQDRVVIAAEGVRRNADVGARCKGIPDCLSDAAAGRGLTRFGRCVSRAKANSERKRGDRGGVGEMVVLPAVCRRPVPR